MDDKTLGRKFDHGKPMPSLLPAAALLAISRVLTIGAKKYAPDNWKYVAGAEKRYMDALWRHLLAYMEGEELDPETGESHMAHIGCNVMFLLWAIESGYTFLPEDNQINNTTKGTS